MNHLDYYNEDELKLLIESAEAHPVCRVPDYLKDQILRKATEQDTHTASLLSFATKVTAAAAAAIALLFAMPEARPDSFFTERPAAENDLTDRQQENTLLNQFSQKTRQLCDLWSETANTIMFKED